MLTPRGGDEESKIARYAGSIVGEVGSDHLCPDIFSRSAGTDRILSMYLATGSSPELGGKLSLCTCRWGATSCLGGRMDLIKCCDNHPPMHRAWIPTTQLRRPNDYHMVVGWGLDGSPLPATNIHS